MRKTFFTVNSNDEIKLYQYEKMPLIFHGKVLKGGVLRTSYHSLDESEIYKIIDTLIESKDCNKSVLFTIGDNCSGREDFLLKVEELNDLTEDLFIINKYLTNKIKIDELREKIINNHLEEGETMFSLICSYDNYVRDTNTLVDILIDRKQIDEISKRLNKRFILNDMTRDFKRYKEKLDKKENEKEECNLNK